jgi:hypothetical protein
MGNHKLFRTDNGETVFEDASTKEDAIAKARELALEKCYHQCCSIKRLVGIDGVIAIAEFIPLECADDTNIYVFWVFQTKVEEQDEDELADAHTETDSYGQLSIKEDLFGLSDVL